MGDAGDSCCDKDVQLKLAHIREITTLRFLRDPKHIIGVVLAAFALLVALMAPSAFAQDGDAGSAESADSGDDAGSADSDDDDDDDNGVTAGVGDDAQVAPPSIGADIPLTYFGPPPSDSELSSLVGPQSLLHSGTTSLEDLTTTIPLYQGVGPNGEPLYYILTETTDAANAAALGLNHSPKLAFANVGDGARVGTLNENFSIQFSEGTVDFSPERQVVPGELPNAFPPAEFQPGAVGDADYSPLVVLENVGGHVYNAPMISFGYTADEISACDGNVNHDFVHDSVVAICPGEEGGEPGTVTIELVPGFSFSKPVLYMSMDSNNPLAATLEKAVLAPGLDSVTVGGDDGAFSAVERIFGFTNGPTGEGNPQRQGFESALRGEGATLNVLGGIPTVATDYSPLWDLNLGEWTQEALDNDYDSRLIEEFQILGFVQDGHITGPGGEAYGSSGIIINCPIVERLL